MSLIDKIRKLPNNPGVYLMKDISGGIIYIGKASDLKKRVSSYFTPLEKTIAKAGNEISRSAHTSRGSSSLTRFTASEKSLKQKVLVSKIKDIDFICTGCEAEALILEAGLIKEHRPKYNVAIKDDKAYPFLKLTINEKFPRLRIVRRKKNDRACYFGPYTSSKLLREALSLMRRIFPLRSCNILPHSVCLNYHIKQCLGPCLGNIDELEYKRVVDNLLLFLQGKKMDLIKNLSWQMKQSASVHNFEQAACLRDQIEILGSVSIANKRYKIADQIDELMSVLKLKRKPLIIEGYDISNISGQEAVGAMVRYKRGYPCKKEYRKFKIKTINCIDDYAMIREVLQRRFSGVLNKQLQLPNLILIDGGRGHLCSAVDELGKFQLNISVISIAKKFEYIYVSWQTKPLALSAQSKALKLLMRIRDEAHRFALSYHRSLRKKQMLISELDQIPGIGPKRKKILLQALNELIVLKRLNLKQLKKIKGIDEKTAKNIIEHWQKY